MPEHSQLRFSLKPRAIALKRELNGVEQILVAKWFRQELDRSCLHGTDRHGDVTVRRNEYDWSANVGRGQLTLELKSAHARQSNIDHQATWHIRWWQPQKCISGSEEFDP